MCACVHACVRASAPVCDMCWCVCAYLCLWHGQDRPLIRTELKDVVKFSMLRLMLAARLVSSDEDTDWRDMTAVDVAKALVHFQTNAEPADAGYMGDGQHDLVRQIAVGGLDASERLAVAAIRNCFLPMLLQIGAVTGADDPKWKVPKQKHTSAGPLMRIPVHTCITRAHLRTIMYPCIIDTHMHGCCHLSGHKLGGSGKADCCIGVGRVAAGSSCSGRGAARQ